MYFNIVFLNSQQLYAKYCYHSTNLCRRGDFMEAMQHFQERLKKLREKEKLNQSELAEKLGVSRGAISYYENGDRVPDIEFLYKTAAFFDVSADYLIGLSNAKKPAYQKFTDQTGFDPATIDRLIHFADYGGHEPCCKYRRFSFELFVNSWKFNDLLEELREYLEMTIERETVDHLDDMYINLDGQVRKISKENLCVLSKSMAAKFFLSKAENTTVELFRDVKQMVDSAGGWKRIMDAMENWKGDKNG